MKDLQGVKLNNEKLRIKKERNEGQTLARSGVRSTSGKYERVTPNLRNLPRRRKPTNHCDWFELSAWSSNVHNRHALRSRSKFTTARKGQ